MFATSALAANKVPVPKQERLVQVYNQLYERAKADPKVSEGRNVANPKHGKVVWSKVRSEYRRLWLEYHPKIKRAIEIDAQVAQERLTWNYHIPTSGKAAKAKVRVWWLINNRPQWEWDCMERLIEGKNHNGENPNWDVRKYNTAGSGAYGIPQSLPAHKMASKGADWRYNPVTQIRWMISYVNGRHNGMCGALQFKITHNWY